MKLDGQLILRGITVEENRFSFEISTLCHLADDKGDRNFPDLEYELRIGGIRKGAQPLVFTGKVPKKCMEPHRAYVYFDKVKHLVRPADHVLSPTAAVASTDTNSSRKSNHELLEFSHRFMLSK
jgi:hypothetical protein